jgi:hypothetical protein
MLRIFFYALWAIKQVKLGSLIISLSFNVQKMMPLFMRRCTFFG